MSGLEATAVLGAISSAITIIDKCKGLYDAANNAQGLPEEFRRVYDSLPIVLNILESVEDIIEERKATTTAPDQEAFEKSVTAIKPIATACDENAKALGKIFEKVFTSEGANFLRRYSRAARTIKPGRKAKVEALMKEILQKLQLLHTDQSLHFYKSCLRVDEVLARIEALSDVESSLDDEGRVVHNGSGSVNFMYGTGDQNNYNQSGDGDMFTGQVSLQKSYDQDKRRRGVEPSVDNS